MSASLPSLLPVRRLQERQPFLKMLCSRFRIDLGQTFTNWQHYYITLARRRCPLERIMREIRRRTRVVGAFPDGQSCLNLAAARLRYIVGTAWSTKCYMNMRPLYQPQLTQTEAVA